MLGDFAGAAVALHFQRHLTALTLSVAARISRPGRWRGRALSDHPGLILPTAWALVRPLTHAGTALDAERTSPGCGRPPGAGQAAEPLRGGGRLASRRDLARPEPAANRQCL